MNSVNTHLYFPADLYDQLVIYAKEQNIPLAQAVRDIVAKKIKKTAKKTPKKDPLGWLASFHIKGPKDLSIHHDKYLYGK